MSSHQISGFHGTVHLSAVPCFKDEDLREVPPSKLAAGEPRCGCEHGLFSHYMCGAPAESACLTRCGCKRFDPNGPKPKPPTIQETDSTHKSALDQDDAENALDELNQFRLVLEALEEQDYESVKSWLTGNILRIERSLTHSEGEKL